MTPDQEAVSQLFDRASDSLREALRAELARFGEGVPTEMSEVSLPMPVSRASQEDYARIAFLWKEFHNNRPIRLTLPERDCPGCGGRNHVFRFVSHDLYPYHLCRDCGTYFVPHLVEEDYIEAFFNEVPEARTVSDRMMEGRDRETMAADHERFDAYFDLADELRGSATGLRYLDIGCGVGHSIDAAKSRGYNAVGLEISRTALATARARGRNCHHPEEWQGSSDFELVSLFETLEHVADPLAMLREARARTGPDGLLVITVPNGASWEVEILGSRSVHVYGGFDGVGHVNLFSPKGLSALLSRAGFKPLLFDGQFGNNPITLASGIVDPTQEALGHAGDGNLVGRLPAALSSLLSNLGPTLTAVDRALMRSPIMISVSCVAGAETAFAGGAERAEARRRAEILASLPPEPAAPPPPPAPKVAIPQDVPLFSEGASLVTKVIDASLASAFQRSGINADVRSGLSVRSYRPLNFDTVLKLGEGKLKAGRYELAAAALVRAGAAALGVLDEAKGEWLTIANIDPTEYFTRLPFEIDATTRVSLFITANNVEAAEVDLELFDLGLAKVG